MVFNWKGKVTLPPLPQSGGALDWSFNKHILLLEYSSILFKMKKRGSNANFSLKCLSIFSCHLFYTDAGEFFHIFDYDIKKVREWTTDKSYKMYPLEEGF